MPLILEGPDHVGKTTFANLLVKEAEALGLPAHYSHMSKPPKNFDWYRNYLQRAQPFAVQDRFHLGGIVYGKLYHGTEITPNSLRMLDAHLALQGSMTIVMYHGSDDTYAQRLEESPKEEMFDPKSLIAVNQMYRGIVRSELVGYEFDITGEIDLDCGFPDVTIAKDIVRRWYNRIATAVELKELPWSDRPFVKQMVFGGSDAE